MYVCMYVCIIMYICVCMYVCIIMCIYICIYIYTSFVFVGDFLVFCRYPKIQWMLPKVLAAIPEDCPGGRRPLHAYLEGGHGRHWDQTLGFYICLPSGYD